MQKKFVLILALVFSSTAFSEEHAYEKIYSLFSPITIAFIFVIGFSLIFFHKKFDRFTVQHGPEILTTIGILGCFAGITFGLFSFDSKEINSSIPDLINGIKSAFISSLLGIFGALTIKFRHSFTKKPIKVSKESPKSASMDDLILLIFDFKKSLIGDHDDSAFSQIKLFRNDTRDHFQKLNSSFDLFASKMIDNNQKALIEALNQVIRDFNEKLTEQFGENFKQLNAAVQHLVIWQQQYKEELDSIKMMQEQTSLDMKIASNSFAALVQDANAFSITAENLKNLINRINDQVEILYVQEKAMSEMMLQMKDVTPQFIENMNQMFQEMRLGINQIQSETNSIFKNHGLQIQSSNEEMKKLIINVINQSQQQLFNAVRENSEMIKGNILEVDGDVRNSIQMFQSEISTICRNFGSQAQLSNAEMKNLLSEIMTKLQRQLSEDLQENSKIIKEGVLALDKALQKELNDALTSLGKQLASLSEKFVSDYLPLTERLREVVHISRNIQ